MKALRWGIAGSGRIAQRFFRDLAHVPDADVAAVWSRNSETGKALAVQANASAVVTFGDLLAANIDALYVATLPDSHAELSARALERGIAVLCEKPAALSAAELASVLRASRTSRTLFMEAMKPPFFPLFQALHRQLEAKPIGHTRVIQSGFSAPTPPEHTSWLSPQLGGGSLFNIGVYHAWLAVHWMGPAQRVQCVGRITSDGVDAFAACLTTHAAGYAQFFSGLDLSLGDGALIAGEHGTVHLPGRWWSPERAFIHYLDGEVAELVEPYEGDGLHFEVTHFCSLLRAGALESPILPHERSSEVLSLIERALNILKQTKSNHGSHHGIVTDQDENL